PLHRPTSRASPISSSCVRWHCPTARTAAICRHRCTSSGGHSRKKRCCASVAPTSKRPTGMRDARPNPVMQYDNDEPGGLRRARVMQKGPLSERIIREYDRMSGQLQKAARYMLERPDDVALLSMREQARCAEVRPATMTRLAQFLGLDGYDQVRDLYANRIRNQRNSFSVRAEAQVHDQHARGERAVAVEMVQSIVDQATNILQPEALDEIIQATHVISACDTLFS